jgi:hypothetical protein
MLVLLDSRLRGNDGFLGNDGCFWVWRVFLGVAGVFGCGGCFWVWRMFKNSEK